MSSPPSEETDDAALTSLDYRVWIPELDPSDIDVWINEEPIAHDAEHGYRYPQTIPSSPGAPRFSIAIEVRDRPSGDLVTLLRTEVGYWCTPIKPACIEPFAEGTDVVREIVQSDYFGSHTPEGEGWGFQAGCGRCVHSDDECGVGWCVN